MSEHQHLISRLLAQSTTDGDLARRREAEQQLRVFASSPGFGELLTLILLDTTSSVSLRQLAGLTLKEVVIKHHWVDDEDAPGTHKLVGNVEKATIREALLKHLGDSTRKIQSVISICIAKIADHDWPENWPILIDVLMSSVMSKDVLLVQGALRCLGDVTEGMTGEQMLVFAPSIVPVLLGIVSEASVPLSLKLRAFAVMRSVVHTLGMLTGVDKEGPVSVLSGTVIRKQYLEQCYWFNCVDSLLSEVPTVKLHYGLQLQAVRLIHTFLQFFADLLVPHASGLAGMLLRVMKMLYAPYQLSVVSTSASEGEADTGYDSEGEEFSLDAEVVQVIETLRIFVISAKAPFRTAVQPLLKDLCYLTVGYMQMTEEQIETWISDPNQYVVDEDDDCSLSNVRNCGEDLMGEISKALKSKGGSQAVYAGAVARLDEAASCADPTQCWKLREASLLALGPIAGPLVQLYIADTKEGRVPPAFDVKTFLNMLHTIIMTPDTTVFLKGRALWCASMFITTRGVPVDAAVPFVPACLLGLDESNSLPVRMIACKALYRLLNTLPPDHSREFIPRIVTELCKLLPATTDDTLHVVLDTLAPALEIDDNMTTRMQPLVTPVVLSLWQARINEPMVLGHVMDVFGLFAKIPATHASLLATLLPVIITVLSNPDSNASGVVETVIDLLDVLVKNVQSPMPPVLFQLVLPPLFQLINVTNDHSVMQSGASVLRSYVRKAPSELAVWANERGNGVMQVLGVVERLLRRELEDPAVLYVGPLVSSIVQRFVAYLDPTILSSMLAAVLRRLHLAKVQSLKNELLFVFARLYNSHGDAVIDLVNRVVLEDGTKGLDFLMQTWTDCHDQYVLSYPRKVSIVALSSILGSKSPFLATIMVKGDEIPDPSASSRGMRTRSQTKKAKYDSVPLGVRIFTLVVRELRKCVADRERARVDREAGEEEWPSEDEEEEGLDGDGMYLGDELDDGDGYVGYPSAEMMDMMGEMEDEEMEEDDDSKADPLFNEDLTFKLTQFITNLAAADPVSFRDMATKVSADDKANLVSSMSRS